jgi:hypothetical protein
VNDGASPRARRAALCLCTVAWLPMAFRSAAAQQGGAPSASPPSKPLTPGESSALLRERDRDGMHPGQALVIVGREQDGNDLRARTPALAQADRRNAIVNVDEVYQRTLAMYEDGTVFHGPPAQLSASDAPLGRETKPRQAAALPDVALVPTPSRWPWRIAGIIVALALLWWLKRAGMLRITSGSNVTDEEIAARR